MFDTDFLVSRILITIYICLEVYIEINLRKNKSPGNPGLGR
jgi:hypothetical protein